jgi:hypothetical protein
MARSEPVCSPFENPACPTPSESGGEMGGQFGGYDLPDMPKETPNMSGLRTLNSTLDVKEGPAPWSTVAIAGGVTTPTVPAGNIDKLSTGS